MDQKNVFCPKSRLIRPALARAILGLSACLFSGFLFGATDMANDSHAKDSHAKDSKSSAPHSEPAKPSPTKKKAVLEKHGANEKNAAHGAKEAPKTSGTNDTREARYPAAPPVGVAAKTFPLKENVGPTIAPDPSTPSPADDPTRGWIRYP